MRGFYNGLTISDEFTFFCLLKDFKNEASYMGFNGK